MPGAINSPTPSGKPRKSGGRRSSIYSILDGLTDRDIQICIFLFEYRVLTTHHLAEVFFSSEGRARKRLLQLMRRGLIARFRPPKRPGSHPQHWVIDELGARIVAGYRGVELKELNYKRERVLRLSKNQRLDHILDVNSFFCRLINACRLAEGGEQVVEWLNEPRARERTMAFTEPDGYGVLEEGESYCSFFLELDRGTEDLERLREKIPRYEHIGFSKPVPALLLFCFHSERREANARRELYAPRNTVVATTTLSNHLTDPLGAIWLPIGERQRFRMLDLTDTSRPHARAAMDTTL